jgi:hypothetical protein
MFGIRIFAALALLSAVAACDDDSAKSGLGTLFAGEVSGEFTGKVVGDGVLKRQAAGDASGQGFFYLADNEGTRDLGVTFVLPNNVAPGHHPIASAGDAEKGKVFSVRIDRDLGSTLHSMEKNAEGYLDIVRFPTDGGKGPVTGTYDVTVEDAEGKAVRVTGVFDFVAK